MRVWSRAIPIALVLVVLAPNLSNAQEYSDEELTWMVGQKLSLAALGSCRPELAENVTNLYADGVIIASALVLTVPELFVPPADNIECNAAALQYILITAGEGLADQMQVQGQTQNLISLLTLSLKSNLIHLLYIAGDEMSDALFDGLASASMGAGVSELWGALLLLGYSGADRELILDATEVAQSATRVWASVQ